MTNRKDAIATLERRAEHLEARIAAGEREGRRGLSFDKAELSALRFLLHTLEENTDDGTNAERA